MEFFAEIILWTAYIISLYFSIFLLLIFLDKRSFFNQEESRSTEPKHFPFVSVIIPAYNEQDTILKTIQSVLNLHYPKENLEIIVVNDGSTDRTKEVVDEFIQILHQKNNEENNTPTNITFISHQNVGKATSMNKALKLAKGEFFACLDADSEVHHLTLKKMVSYYQEQNNPRLAIITPAMKVKDPKKILQRIQWIEYLLMILVSRLSAQIDSVYVAPGPFSLYKTSIIKKLGGFDPTNLTEDQEIAYRVQKESYLIKQCFDGYVYTNSPGTLKAFYKQRRRWYQGSISCLHQYRSMVLDRKYGDFGIMQMTKNVFGFVLAFTGFFFAFYYLILPVIKKMKNAYILNFDFLVYLKNLSLSNFNILNFEFKKIFIFIFLISITFTFFYLAHKNANEKIRKHGYIHFIPYFAVYYLIKGTILILSLIQFSIGKKTKW
ncbi:glycosyltransferase [Candidatus Woesearchaeota archaeon]|nr:glycosyltransferase [Candidatus Woesearchaeota archaeon]